ncbi:M60 family metallopeptidase [Mycoplasma seminis]|uniref:M60 family metallopeptidase n=1 Tax=Mycoplasma seminis TaxID=512749 RepID=A0ABY9H9B5_9MOLU|nr:M60 family metallopeptidase [Mycoplasma seminis]WLP85180.1 M60 family metallopeptidase [Mycoplasma seminis]
MKKNKNKLFKKTSKRLLISAAALGGVILAGPIACKKPVESNTSNNLLISKVSALIQQYSQKINIISQDVKDSYLKQSHNYSVISTIKPELLPTKSIDELVQIQNQIETDLNLIDSISKASQNIDEPIQDNSNISGELLKKAKNLLEVFNTKLNMLNEYQKTLHEYVAHVSIFVNTKLNGFSFDSLINDSEVQEFIDELENNIDFLDILLSKENINDLKKDINNFQTTMNQKIASLSEYQKSLPEVQEFLKNKDFTQFNNNDWNSLEAIDEAKEVIRKYEAYIKEINAFLEKTPEGDKKKNLIENIINLQAKYLDEYNTLTEMQKNHKNAKKLHLDFANKSKNDLQLSNTDHLEEISNLLNNELINEIPKLKSLEDPEIARNKELQKNVEVAREEFEKIELKLSNFQKEYPDFKSLDYERLINSRTTRLSNSELDELLKDLHNAIEVLNKLSKKDDPTKEMDKIIKTLIPDVVNKKNIFSYDVKKKNIIFPKYDTKKYELKIISLSPFGPAGLKVKYSLILKENPLAHVENEETIAPFKKDPSLKTYQDLRNASSYMYKMYLRLNDYQKSLPEYKNFNAELMKYDASKAMKQAEHDEILKQFNSNTELLINLAKIKDPNQKPYTDLSDDNVKEFKKFEFNESNTNTKYKKTTINDLNSFNTSKLEILNKYSRLEVANNVPTGHSKYQDIPQAPDYMGLNNNWRSLDSKFAKETNSKTAEELNENIKKWQREMNLNDADDSVDPNMKISGVDKKYGFWTWLKEEVILDKIYNKKLNKHPAIDHMFGDLSVKPTQQAANANWTISPTFFGVLASGLYAPAGEVITMRIPQSQVEIVKKMNLEIQIGKEFLRGEIGENTRGWTNLRLPNMTTYFSLNLMLNEPKWHKDVEINGTQYVEVKFGSSFGGTISLNNMNKMRYFIDYSNDEDITFNISGAIQNLHYQLGITTPQQWEDMIKNTRTPVFTAVSDSISGFMLAYDSKGKDIAYESAKKQFDKNGHLPFDYFSKISEATKTSRYMNNQDRNRLDKKGWIQYWLINDAPMNIYAYNASTHFVGPIGFGHEMLVDSDDTFSPVSNWGFMHELNHSYEWDMFANNKPGETINNVNSVVEYQLFSNTTAQRREDFPTGINQWGWGPRAIPYTNIKKETANSAEGLNTTNQWDAIFMLAGTLGPKNWIEFARLQSLYMRQKNDFFTLTVNDPEIASIITDYNKYGTLSTPYLLSLVSGADLTQWLEKSVLFDLIIENKNSSKEEMLQKWAQLKSIIQRRYQKFAPFSNMYASGNFIKQKDGTWIYGGDAIRPYEVSFDVPTIFDMNKFTTISNHQNLVVPIIGAKVLNTPSSGTISYPQPYLIKYTPNKGVKINDMDYLEVELTDANGEIYRVVIRPLFGPFRTTNSTYSITKYEVPHNSWFEIDNKLVPWQTDAGDLNQMSTLQFDTPLLNKSEATNNKIKFFEQFDEIKSQCIKDSTTSVKEIAIGQDLSLKNLEFNNENEIIRLKTTFIAQNTGWHKVHLRTNKPVQLFVTIKNRQTNETKVVYARDSRNPDYKYGYSLWTDGSLGFELTQGLVYDINVYALMSSTAYFDENQAQGLDITNIEILKLKNKESDNWGGSALEFFNNMLPKTLSHGFETAELFNKYGTDLFNTAKEYRKRFYSWGIENLDFLNYDFSTWKMAWYDENGKKDPSQMFNIGKNVKPGTWIYAGPKREKDTSMPMEVWNMFQESSKPDNFIINDKDIKEVLISWETQKPFFASGFNYNNIGNIKYRPNKVEIYQANDENHAQNKLIWSGEIKDWNIAGANNNNFGLNRTLTSFNDTYLFNGKITIKFIFDKSQYQNIPNSNNEEFIRISHFNFVFNNPQYDLLVGVKHKDVTYNNLENVEFSHQNTRVDQVKATLKGQGTKMTVALNENIQRVMLFGDKTQDYKGIYKITVLDQNDAELFKTNVWDTTASSKAIYNVPFIETTNLPKGKKTLIIETTSADSNLPIQYVALKKFDLYK